MFHRALFNLAGCCSLALAALLPAGSHAAHFYVDPPEQLGVAVFSYAPRSNGAFWTWGDNGVRLTRSNGETTRFFQGGSSGLVAIPQFYQARALADGGLLQFNRDCAMRYIEASSISRGDLPLPPCDGTDANANGVIWSWKGGTVRRIRLDASVQQQLQVGEAGADESVARLAVQPDGGFYLLTFAAEPRARRVARYGADGELRWSWHGDGMTLHGFAAAADGVFAYGRGENGDAAVARLDESGKLRWHQRYDIDPASGFNVFGLYPADDGSAYLVSGQEGFGMTFMKQLARVSADGKLVWQTTFCPGADSTPLGTLVVDADSNVAQLCPAGTAGQRLVRRDPRGNVAASIAVPLSGAGDLQRDGDTLLLSGRRADAPLAMVIVAVERDNQLRDTAVAGITDYASMQLLAQAMDAAGNTYLLSQVNDYQHTPQRQFLSKVGSDGLLRWRREIPSGRVYSASLSVTAERVCSYQRADAADGTASLLRAFCLDAGSGSDHWMRETAVAPYATPAFVHAAADGSVKLLHSLPTEPRTHELLRVSSDGRTLGTTRGNGDALLAAFDTAGRTTVVAERSLLQYSESGSLNYSTSAGDISPYGGELVATGDGGVVMSGNLLSAAMGRGLRRVGADGREHWSRQLDASYRGSQLLLAGDAVYVLQHSQLIQGTPPQDNSRLRKFSLADGRQRWHFDSINPYVDFSTNRRGGAMATTARGDLLLMHASGGYLRLQRLDGASGMRLDDRKIECNVRCSHPAALNVEASGSARLVLPLHHANYGLTTGVLTIDGADADLVLTRIDQRGITRAWGNSFSNGEGLLLDWLPDSRTLFGAWFTFERDGGSEQAHLRWYTLQASAVTPGATALELPILQTSGGSFAAGPPVAPTVVGKATLRFADCGRVLLDYAFDPPHNGAAQGRLTLWALSRQLFPCERADGSLVAPFDLGAPQLGFDARMSGTWFDPATPGQGLQLIVQPGRTLFAPWFTFDPAGSSNDPTSQHWFTLQGELDRAADGVVQLQLVQTLGGRFDSRATFNTTVVGGATLRMLACDRAQLDYFVDSDARAGAFAGRSGALMLQKAGGCAPPQ